MSGTALVLTAHGSVDPRAAANTHAVADQIRLLRPSLNVRVAFCEKSTPNLLHVLTALDGPAVVTPLLLANAYHARVDIPDIIAEARAGSAHAEILRAETLGEDPRLVHVMRQRLDELDIDLDRDDCGVLVVAVGSTHAEANAGTATLANAMAHGTRCAGVRVAYATGPAPSVADGIAELRHLGARRIALAPWFIAGGRITDRVAAIAAAEGMAMAGPLGAHPLLAETLLDRFDRAIAQRLAA
ncbi:MAG: sirohydrochlorin chelatase [Mycobacterium sp.]|nr:sirohydrochlorin chelatase [Mycobacterium sp.]